MTLEDEGGDKPESFDGEPHAQRLGPYRLLHPLGRGGMGEVWLAEQLAPIRRQVAIKILKLGMDTRDLIARFEAERQMLALMDHPNIASIFDAGVTATGRPYFVMEVVRGVPITEYCDGQRLPTGERLRMFSDVCRAVQHAHHKGVIHRDLKPSNVLITAAAGGPVVKIIDFGVGKAIAGQWLTDKTLHTQVGQKLGTPAYMSPEQVEGSGIDIDTRSDLYSLGVMLYELLLGSLPFHARPGTALEDAIREDDVERPSARLRTLPTRETVARLRQTTLEDLRRQLSGDLDWIVLRAMEKDRTRRYETANDLALELERFLRHEPISARPPSTAYRLRKFARRNRAATAAAAVAFIGLAFGAGAAATGLVRARRSETLARREAATAREVSNFLVNLFAISNPSEARGNTVTAREILDRGAARVRTDVRSDRHVRGRLLGAIGNVYRSLGLYAQAESLLRDALAIDERPGGTAMTVSDLAYVIQRQGRHAEADSLLRLAISARTKGGRVPDTVTALLMTSLAFVEMHVGHTVTADTLLRAALRLEERTPSPDSLLLARTLGMLARLHDDDPTTYEPVMRRAFDIQRAVDGPDHPRTLSTAHDLGIMLFQLGRFAESERQLQEVVVENERVLGAQHPGLGISLMDLGMIQLSRKRPVDAVATLDRALHLLSGADSAFVGYALEMLARGRLQLEELDMAERLFLRSLAVLEHTRGPHHNWTAQARTGLGELYAKTKRFVKAEASLRQAIRDQERNWGPRHREMIAPLVALGSLYTTMLRFTEADSLYRWAIRAADSGLVDGHPERVEVRREYASLLRTVGKATVADSVERGIVTSRQP